MYTSGTTGEPKGVEISHQGLLVAIGALILLMKQFGVTFGWDSSRPWKLYFLVLSMYIHLAFIRPSIIRSSRTSDSFLIQYNLYPVGTCGC
jgi:acyl-coenzyme A synthetase/AMP-(fatty) acid ligase